MLNSTGACVERNIPSRVKITVLKGHHSWRGRPVAARGPAARIPSFTDKVDAKQLMLVDTLASHTTAPGRWCAMYYRTA